jgi:MFS transporter, FLVCR family, MFS-domain-containing protein 7
MTNRERLDFLIIFLLFGLFIGGSNAFSLLTAEELVRTHKRRSNSLRHNNAWYSFLQVPVGYSTDLSGIMGATLLLSGIIAAIVTVRDLICTLAS